jgi:hypothetical protein
MPGVSDQIKKIIEGTILAKNDEEWMSVEMIKECVNLAEFRPNAQ